ncbi:MAG: O-antigen ligase family protein [Aquabacterium sp.]|uniref:O-antigen ligase family protein n=1 Tax=Aquabacterium sp. TaxID=1872578 RepID=UPI0025C22D82|nr:O-antigen ligase family protein [Aquabacterium sp.]MBI5926095.1 O-antigen ligase family protein [Aquabacterium sp.]
MQTALNTKGLIVRFAFHLNLFLLLLADRNALWTNATVLLPWILILTSQEGRATTVRIALLNRFITATSIGLSTLLFSGCLSHACTKSEYESIFIPILWLPIASLFESTTKKNTIAIYITIATATISASILIIWQLAIEKHERPGGFSFNVMNGPMLLAMLCILCATKKKSSPSALTRSHPALIAIGIAAAICTLAKTALLTFLTGLTTYVIRKPRDASRTIALSLPLIIIWTITLSTKLQTVQTDVIKYSNSQYRTSLGERTDAIRWSTEHILDNPLLGKGSHQLDLQFNDRWRDWGRPKSSITSMRHLHNDYLQIAISRGIPASMAFIASWIALAIIASQVKIEEKNSAHHDTVTWMLVLATIYMTAFMTDSFTHWNCTWANASCCFGIALAIIKKQRHIGPN